MAGTRTLTMTPGFDIEREPIIGLSTVDFDSVGMFASFNRSERPSWRFKMKLDALNQIEQQSLQAFYNFHMAGKAFFWDGGNWSAVTTLSLVGEGDGTRTEYFLPNRFIDSSSLTMGIWNSGDATSETAAFSLNPDPGIVVFDTAPDSGDDIMASHGHKYRLLFERDGFKIKQFAKGVWRAELSMREILLPLP